MWPCLAYASRRMYSAWAAGKLQRWERSCTPARATWSIARPTKRFPTSTRPFTSRTRSRSARWRRFSGQSPKWCVTAPAGIRCVSAETRTLTPPLSCCCVRRGKCGGQYFTVKPQPGVVATSFKEGDKVYIASDKLLPLQRFLPQPKAPKGVWTTRWPVTALAHGLTQDLLPHFDLLIRFLIAAGAGAGKRGGGPGGRGGRGGMRGGRGGTPRGGGRGGGRGGFGGGRGGFGGGRGAARGGAGGGFRGGLWRMAPTSAALTTLADSAATP